MKEDNRTDFMLLRTLHLAIPYSFADDYTSIMLYICLCKFLQSNYECEIQQAIDNCQICTEYIMLQNIVALERSTQKQPAINSNIYACKRLSDYCSIQNMLCTQKVLPADVLFRTGFAHKRSYPGLSYAQAEVHRPS